MKAEKLTSLIKEGIGDAKIRVRDLTGTEDHYEVVVGSPRFEGLSRVQQHRLVYQALGNALSEELHALSIKTCSLEEWEKQSFQS